jgi:hypothetical protein
MTYRGHVKNGQITLDEPASLPEGAEVQVQVVSQQSQQPGEALDRLAGKAKGLPADLAQRHDHYRRERRAS